MLQTLKEIDGGSKSEEDEAMEETDGGDAGQSDLVHCSCMNNFDEGDEASSEISSEYSSELCIGGRGDESLECRDKTHEKEKWDNKFMLQ